MFPVVDVIVVVGLSFVDVDDPELSNEIDGDVSEEPKAVKVDDDVLEESAEVAIDIVDSEDFVPFVSVTEGTVVLSEG